MTERFSSREKAFAEGFDAPETSLDPQAAAHEAPGEPSQGAEQPGPSADDAACPKATLDTLRLTLRELGYHPVPAAGKRVLMPGWQRVCRDADALKIKRWSDVHADHTNTGLLCGTLVGVDVDVLQPDLAEAISQMVIKRLGPTPLCRIGRAPKVLFAYRLATPISKLQTAARYFTDDPEEKPTRVEVLAHGQQFIAFGKHPETQQPYYWPEGSPLTVAFSDLPEITETALQAVLAEAETILRKGGARTRSEQRQETGERERAGWRASGLRRNDPADQDTIASALESIANDFDYDGWIRIGYALYDGLGDAGRDLWEKWSAGSPRNDPALTAATWPHFAKRRTITVGTLFWHASQNGWARRVRPSAVKRSKAGSDDQGAAHGETGDGRPIVFVAAGKTPKAADRTEMLLREAGVDVFSRAGVLARPVTDTVPAAKGRMTTVARLRSLCATSLSDIAARVMRFQRFDKRGQEWVDTNPPVEVMMTLLVREGEWHLPSVAGVITTPTLRPDGSVLSTPGYDPETRLFLALDRAFQMPPLSAQPSRAEAEAALRLLEDLLSGFPFVQPVDRAVALSGILTAVVRGTLPVAPLHAIRAHSPGTGKSLLVDIASAIATGRHCPVIAAGKTEEETEKRLGALLRDAAAVVSLDNVNGELGGDMLCQLTERPVVKVRILGKSEAPELECRCAVFATGNNLTLVGDMTRRTVLCTLDAKVERPELRTFDFDPVERVLADRGAYVAAALTIVRAYRAAGSPTVCGPIGSYGDWSATVRAPLIWLGHADPVASMETAREEDPALSAVRELFGHWREHLSLASGYTTNAIIKAACEKAPGLDFNYGSQEFKAPEFRDLLLRVAGDGGAVNSRRLGKWLSGISGRVVESHRLEMRVDGSNGNRFSLVGPAPYPTNESEF
ncbi:PriCT-2 domain-containing protein [Methylobacterium nigriterrae]|uniref:PriCT-2 domain-containing protein n=1 Tax=Methylobacterium nigriterrae TaxID=3127512 RepID=UPI0030141D20